MSRTHPSTSDDDGNAGRLVKLCLFIYNTHIFDRALLTIPDQTQSMTSIRALFLCTFGWYVSVGLVFVHSIPNDMYLIQTLLASLWFSFYFNSLVVQGRFLLLLLLYPTLLIRTMVKYTSSRRQGRWNNCPRKTTCLHFRKEWRRVSLENIFFPKIWS